MEYRYTITVLFGEDLQSEWSMVTWLDISSWVDCEIFGGHIQVHFKSNNFTLKVFMRYQNCYLLQKKNPCTKQPNWWKFSMSHSHTVRPRFAKVPFHSLQWKASQIFQKKTVSQSPVSSLLWDGRSTGLMPPFCHLRTKWNSGWVHNIDEKKRLFKKVPLLSDLVVEILKLL